MVSPAFDFHAAEIMTARVDQLRRLDRLPGAFAVRPAGPDDGAALGAFLGDADKAARLRASGDLGLLAVADEQVQAMEWIRFGPATYDWDVRNLGVAFRLPARYCWLHNGSGNGLGSWAVVMGRLPHLLQEHGVDVAYLQVDSKNKYSVRCHESLGFRKIGRVTAVRIAGRTIVWVTTERTSRLRAREVSLALDELGH